MPNLPWSFNSVYEMTLIGSCLGSAVVNTLHYEASTAEEATLTSDAVAQASGAALADDWIASMMTTWRGAHGSEYFINMVKVQVVERPGNFRHKLTPTERPITSNNNGTVVTMIVNSLTNSAVVRWRTPQAGKRTRGRMYVGPIGEDWMNDGRLQAAATTAIGAWCTAQRGRYTGAGSEADRWHQAIYSRPYNMGEYQYTSRKSGSLQVVTPPDYAGNSTFVTDHSIDPIVRNQRRRQVGVGA